MTELPFLQKATLKTQTNEVIATYVPISIWPANQTRITGTGATWDHEAEIPLSYQGHLELPNVKVECDGVNYLVVERAFHSFMPHVALFLRRTRSGG